MEDKIQRQVLPIPDPQHVGVTTYDAKDPDTYYPPIEPLRPPKGAPNVLIVLIDDVGFGASSAFGGPCQTPTAESLAGGRAQGRGVEAGSPVSADYGPRGNTFNGEINWVELDIDKDALDQDHFLTGEECFKVALALQ